jgi:thiamine transport system substrate-binding protein
MKRALAVIPSVLALLAPASALAARKVPELVVYTYDSFQGKDTLGQYLAERSVEKTGCSVKYVAFSSAGEALAQVALEKNRPKADIVVGMDHSFLEKAQSLSFETLDPELFSSLDPLLARASSRQFLPFDYGFLALVYDDRRKNLPAAGTSLKAFAANPQYRKRLALEDARTSSLGKSLVTWVKALTAEKDRGPLWKQLFSQSLIVAPGWSAAYGSFLNGEVDFVFSYTTSPAYHLEKEKNTHIRAVIFPEGHYRQVEMAGILSSSIQKECAKKWLGLLVSAEAQAALPLLQWMYPARAGVALPASFRHLSVPSKIVEPQSVPSATASEIHEWAQWSAGVK